jgi:iron complex transport system permease protein
MKLRGMTVLALVLIVAAVARVMIGPAEHDGRIHLAFGIPTTALFRLRIGAVLSAGFLGAALGLAGLALQVLLRNPLASPFVLGISSGAGFGVALVLALAWRFSLPAIAFGGEVVGAAVGALSTLALVAWLGRSRTGHDTTTLLLAGVILGGILSAGTMLLEQLVPHGLRGDLLSWMAGRLPELPTTAASATLVCCVALGLLVMQLHARALDVACLSDEEASSSGVNLRRLRVMLFLVGGLLAAVAVAYAGPIGFIGLVGPHLARRLIGAHHQWLVPGAAVAGAALLVTADVARQLIDVGTGRLPVGVVTALAGGPAFLWLLRSGRWRT